MPDILYEDDFVTLNEDFLTIKRYFFPMLKPKVIRVRDIRVLYFDEQNNGKYTLLRTWGKSHDNDIYWANDFRRFVFLPILFDNPLVFFCSKNLNILNRKCQTNKKFT